MTSSVRSSRRLFLAAVAIVGVLSLAACRGSGRDATADSSASAVKAPIGTSTPRIAAAPLPAADSVSAHAPTWSMDLVLGALRSAGLTPVERGAAKESFLGVPGRLVEIPNAELEVFIYGDAIAAARDIDRLDTLAVSPRGTKLVWRKPPALVTSNNLVVIVLTDSSATRARVRQVLGSISQGK